MFSITHLWAGVSLPTYNSSLSSLSSCSWSASLSPPHKTIIKLLQSPGNGGKNEWVWLSTCLSRQLGSGWKLKPGSLMILAWPAWENEPSSQSRGVESMTSELRENGWRLVSLVTALTQREPCSGACLSLAPKEPSLVPGGSFLQSQGKWVVPAERSLVLR